MGGSIGACIREKNRWSGKAMFTESHESGQEDVLMVSGLTPSSERRPEQARSHRGFVVHIDPM